VGRLYSTSPSAGTSEVVSSRKSLAPMEPSLLPGHMGRSTLVACVCAGRSLRWMKTWGAMSQHLFLRLYRRLYRLDLRLHPRLFPRISRLLIPLLNPPVSR